jgi:membrane-bound lytic murein transglycosylase D
MWQLLRTAGVFADMRVRSGWILGLIGTIVVPGWAAPAGGKAAANPVAGDELYQLGKDLFDTYAPDEVKAQYEFPDKAQWDRIAIRLQAALDGNDPAALARLEPEARSMLTALETVPGSEEYIDWLKERLDYIEAAKQIGLRVPKPPGRMPGQVIPEYDLWLKRLSGRPRPAAAAEYVAMLHPVFAAAGIPGELVWLAEVESSFNPTARSPVGARGLFQLMPATAEELGLSTFLPDERINPTKSAQAAAQMLGDLYKRFGDWPLALAAYNAGAGRVRRTLTQENAKTFAEIAPLLPMETRLYVPKVLALLQVRAGRTLVDIARR